MGSYAWLYRDDDSRCCAWMMKKRHRRLIIGLVIVTLLPVTLFLLDSNKLVVTRYEVTRPDLPLSFDGYKIVQVSDFHNEALDYANQNIIEAIVDENPDIIVLTGDFIDEYTKNLDRVTAFLIGLASYPILYENGNHDIRASQYPAFLDLLDTHGVINISGARHTVTRSDDKLAFIGVEQTDVEGYWGFKASEAVVLEPSIGSLLNTDDDFTILSSHHPDFYNEAATLGVDLMLSGHFHGGHIRLFNWSPAKLLDETFAGGHFNVGMMDFIVSRGAGSGFLPIRINCDAEIVTITLKHAS